MAVISAPDLDDMRQEAARHIKPVTYLKSDINAALQAIEDWEVDAHTLTPVLSRETVIENALGFALPLRTERVFWMVWSEWKQGQLRGDI